MAPVGIATDVMFVDEFGTAGNGREPFVVAGFVARTADSRALLERWRAQRPAQKGRKLDRHELVKAANFVVAEDIMPFVTTSHLVPDSILRGDAFLDRLRRHDVAGSGLCIATGHWLSHVCGAIGVAALTSTWRHGPASRIEIHVDRYNLLAKHKDWMRTALPSMVAGLLQRAALRARMLGELAPTVTERAALRRAARGPAPVVSVNPKSTGPFNHLADIICSTFAREAKRDRDAWGAATRLRSCMNIEGIPLAPPAVSDLTSAITRVLARV